MANAALIKDIVKKITIGLLLLVILMVTSVFLLLPYIIDRDAMKDEFITSFKAATGFNLEFSGDVEIKPFPVPHLVMNSLYVHNSIGGSSPFLFSIKLVELWPSYTALLGKQKTISSIRINDLDIELERLKDGQLNWEDPMTRTTGRAESLSSLFSKSNLKSASLRIRNGYLHYTDDVMETSKEYKDVSVAFFNGGSDAESTLQLGFVFAGKRVAASGKIRNIAQAFSTGEEPASVSVTSGKSMLTYDGKVGYKEGKPSISGKMKCVTDDVGQWLEVIAHGGKSNTANTVGKLLPLEATSDIATEHGIVIFPEIAIKSDFLKGTAHTEIAASYVVNVTGKIETFNLEELLANAFFAPPKKVDEEKAEEEAAQGKSQNPPQEKNAAALIAAKTLFYSLDVSSDITIGDIFYNGQHIKKTHIESDFSDGVMTISQATATFPGEGRLVFSGIGRDGFQGFTLEGEVDMSGKNFAQLLPLLKTNGIPLPTQDFARYKLKTNISLSPKELRMSEVSARVGDTGFAGGFIAMFGERVKLVAALKIEDLNLDHFIDAFRLKEWRASFRETAQESQHESAFVRWLKQLDYDANLNLVLGRFILADRPRDFATLKVTTSAGQFAIDDLKTEFNGTHLEGGVRLDVMGTLPKIVLKLTADALDAQTFFTADGQPAPATPRLADVEKTGRWSHDSFDFRWLDLLEASYHLKIGRYTQGMLTAEDLDIQGGISERNFTIDSMTGLVLGARMGGKFSIKGGKIPAINFAATVTDLDSTRIAFFLPLLGGVAGKYNVVMKFETSGIDMYSWMSSLQGTLGISGNKVEVPGFNLAGVIHAVGYVRTVADILNVVKRAWPGGSTMFNNVEGQWTVANGVFKTAGARLVGTLCTGMLSSETDMVNWKTRSIITLALTPLDSQHPPELSISFDGDLDHPDVTLDTRQLEQFVSNRTSEQMLQQYGTPP